MTNFMKNFRPFGKYLATAIAISALLLPCTTRGEERSAQGVKVIALDAGHGGRFPGACVGGVAEKDINLQVVLKLGALIEKKMPNVKVVYTRTVDTMLSSVLGADLQERANIAHRNNADLFVSVHSNAMPNKSEVRGTLTLIMGETTGEKSRNENALYANNKEELLDMSDQKTATIVRAYIQNLQYTYGMYSEMLGRFIQDEYAGLGYRDHGVRGQPLKVLYSTDMPSVLTEIGFMTNPEDLKIITSEEGQKKIAAALFRAIERYIDVVNRSLLVENPQGAAKKSEQAEKPKAEKPKAKEVEKPKVEKVENTEKTKVEEKKPVTERSEPQPAPNTKPQKSEKRYTIQIMAGNAKVAITEERFKWLRNKVWIMELPGDVKYRYCYGDFASADEARKYLDDVHTEYPRAFVVPYNR